MAFPFFSGKRGSASPTKRQPKPVDLKKSQAHRKLEEIRLQQLEIEFKREKILQRLEDFPRQQEEQNRKRLEFIKERARNTATTYADGAPQKQLHSIAAVSSRMSKGEKRLARTKLIILCLILLGFLLMLLRVLR